LLHSAHQTAETTAAQDAPVLRLLRTTIARIVLGIVLAVGLYALAGFVVAPKILRSELLTEIPKTVDVVPTVGDIHLNPFLFQLDVRNFALAGHDGTRLLKFDRLFVDFDLSSLWHRAYTFGQIELDGPAVNAVVAPDGVINLLALEPKEAPAPAKPPPEKNAPLPALRIGSFRVTQGSLSYEDRSRPTLFAARVEPIAFELKDFTTGVAGGLFTFTGASKQGERLEWHGHLSVQPVASDGELHIQGLQARTLWEYLQDQVNFVVASGTIEVESTYKFSLTDQINLGLDVSKATIADLAVRPRDSATDWVNLPALDMSGMTVDLAQHSAAIDSLSLSGLKILAWLEPDGAINLLELAAPAKAAAQTPPPHGGATQPASNPLPATAPRTVSASAPTVTSSAPAGATPWKLDLRELSLREAGIFAEDRTVQPAVKVALAPLSLDVRGVSLDMSKPVKVALDTKINQSGALAVDGEITPQPLAVALKVKMSGIDLTTAQPYVARQTAMILRSGKLGGETQVSYGGKPAIKLSGDLYVENLRTVDAARHDDFISWDRLDVRGLDFEQSPNRLAIAEIAARKMYARVIIEPDTSLNVARVLQGPGGAPASAPPKPANSAEPAKPAPPSGQAPPAQGAPAPSERGGAVKSVAVKPAPSPTAWPMSIKKIRLTAGRTDFTDLSIKPNFSAGIRSLEGTVLGLSSDPKSRAKVDLHGSVDQFAPVSISGELNVLSAALYSDLTMDFRNIELSIFNPYSGKWAGYNITKGKLTAEMHYKVVERQLDAEHHIVIDQLEFGDKTESKDAVSLPVKLAVALLKDRNGVIDLPLPVTGSLDDPHFRLGPIIWKVVVNLLEKAVTAPFALLGRLFGSGPDLQFIDFQPGSSELSSAESDKVKSIVKALQERPQLKLEVPIAAVPDLDRPALLGAALDAQIAEVQAGMQKGSRKGSAAPPAFDQLDPSAKLEALTRLYQRDMGGEPKYPDTVTAIKQKPDLIAAKVDFLSGQLRDHATVGADQLTALGQQRALAVQRALLTDTGVDAARVFLVANDKAQAKDGAVRLELSLR
jgi:uncharacterized protein DUF748